MGSTQTSIDSMWRRFDENRTRHDEFQRSLEELKDMVRTLLVMETGSSSIIRSIPIPPHRSPAPTIAPIPVPPNPPMRGVSQVDMRFAEADMETGSLNQDLQGILTSLTPMGGGHTQVSSPEIVVPVEDATPEAVTSKNELLQQPFEETQNQPTPIDRLNQDCEQSQEDEQSQDCKNEDSVNPPLYDFTKKDSTSLMQMGDYDESHQQQGKKFLSLDSEFKEGNSKFSTLDLVVLDGMERSGWVMNCENWNFHGLVDNLGVWNLELHPLIVEDSVGFKEFKFIVNAREVFDEMPTRGVLVLDALFDEEIPMSKYVEFISLTLPYDRGKLKLRIGGEDVYKLNTKDELVTAFSGVFFVLFVIGMTSNSCGVHDATEAKVVNLRLQWDPGGLLRLVVLLNGFTECIAVKTQE